jgi:hypothetical protein
VPSEEVVNECCEVSFCALDVCLCSILSWLGGLSCLIFRLGSEELSDLQFKKDLCSGLSCGRDGQQWASASSLEDGDELNFVGFLW